MHRAEGGNKAEAASEQEAYADTGNTGEGGSERNSSGKAWGLMDRNFLVPEGHEQRVQGLQICTWNTAELSDKASSESSSTDYG